MNTQKVLAAAAILAAAGTAFSQVTLTDLGIAAPPATLDGYDLNAAPTDTRAIFGDVFDVDLGDGSTLNYDIAMNHRKIGQGWATWSHGYFGDVYFSNGLSEVNMSFSGDDVQAFVIYVEPNTFAVFEFEIEATSSSGDVQSATFTANGSSGANGFGISVPAGQTVESVRVTNTDGLAAGFAVGEFFTDGEPAGPCDVTEGDFTAEATDDYESYPGGRTTISSVFGGSVPVIPGAVDHRSVDFGNWSDFRSPGGPIQPSSGSRFGVQYGFGDFTLDFTGLGGITGFKGMASAAGVGNDVVTFFDMGGGLLCQFVIAGGFGPGDGSMVPFSWVSDTLIGSVNLSGSESCFDDIGYTTGGTGCVADCDGDGVLTLFDFLCFQNQFDAGDLAADLDGDGLLTLFDFLAFQNAFDAGCE